MCSALCTSLLSVPKNLSQHAKCGFLLLGPVQSEAGMARAENTERPADTEKGEDGSHGDHGWVGP